LAYIVRIVGLAASTRNEWLQRVAEEGGDDNAMLKHINASKTRTLKKVRHQPHERFATKIR
jgi:hypothetical protein